MTIQEDMDLDVLASILEAEVENYTELHAYEQKKCEYLLKGQNDILMSLLSQEESLMFSLRKLEKKRYLFLDAWKQVKKWPCRPTLKEIIENSPKSKTRQRIETSRKILLKKIDDIKKQNDSNEMLVKSSLDHIKEFFNILTGNHECLAYQEKGKKSDLGKQYLLDQSV
jgi:flagellar biosynthesis/type III secretory pathway chaperone